MRVGHSAADHHQVDPVGKPFVTKGRKLEEVGPQGFECFHRVGKIAAERFVLRVSHAKPAPSSPTARLIQFQPGGKRPAASQCSDRLEIGVLPESLCQAPRSARPATGRSRGAFSSAARAPGIISIAPITGSLAPSRKVA